MPELRDAAADDPTPALRSAPVRTWFARRFGAPTDPQRLGWPHIARRSHTLIAAPTGSGKTLAAFLVAIDRLVERALEGKLEDRLDTVYVSPLRALSHDIQRNLEAPLAEIRAVAAELGLELPEIRAAVRTGDTPAAERQALLRRPPHILVTTPESLYLLLTAERGRELLANAETVIVDEIHALARDKRGSHLALSLERLDALAGRRLLRVGLSATQRPIEGIARFLVGTRASAHSGAQKGAPDCAIVDLGHQRDLDLAIELPAREDLAAVASLAQWDDLFDSLAAQIQAHRTTLVFCNTRRLAERVAHALGEKLGPERVAAHHGSLSRERRLRVEQRLRDGELAALVATASLELGIDIGAVELVCQIGSPRSIATFLQRIGRSGHALGLTPRGRLYPMTRDELVECAALLRAARAGRLDRVEPPRAPLDILAQQVVATVACGEQGEDELFELFRGASPYAELAREDYDAVLEMLAHGFETPRGRRGTYLHRDRLERRLRPRRNARIAALTSGGAIPDSGDYRVILDPSDLLVGTVNEDFAIESLPGDVFLLGTHSWRIRRVESGVVRVSDAEGAPPTIPFWVGEAPSRTAELSREVSELRADVALELGSEQQIGALAAACALPLHGARQIVDYVRAQVQSIGRVPTQSDVIAERFFDDSGGMQLVIHSPYGNRINRGYGLALRKKLCRSFNQELQAAASDDAVVLSLGAAQTFPLESLPRFLAAATIEETLEQAFLGSPLFGVRWRWNATRSLAILRSRGGTRVPFPLQRMQADDLLAAAFPEQTACQENVEYPIDIPDHPLVRQTVHDCLHEASDLPGLRALLERIAAGEVRFHTVDTVEPSPFAHEILSARPYAFLDDAPLEERRTQAVVLRRVLPEQARDLAKLEPAAIARVREEAAPHARDADELYEALLDLVLLDARDLPCSPALADALVAAGRAARARGDDGRPRLFAAERLPQVRALLPQAPLEPELALPVHLAGERAEPEAALDAAVRGHLAVCGPTTVAGLAERIGAGAGDLPASLARLEARGVCLRGRFDPDLEGEQFCERSLLARIHRYTLVSLRREIEPVSAQVFLRFLLHWQHLEPDSHKLGEGGLLAVIDRLSGFEAPAAAWESELLAPRLERYRPELLDALCLSGAAGWGRLGATVLDAAVQSSRATPIALYPRADLEALLHASEGGDRAAELRGPARRVFDVLRARGACFGRELELLPGLLPIQVEEALRELIARGLVSCDGFAPLRRLLAVRPPGHRRGRPGRGTRVLPRGLPVPEGRWSLLTPIGARPDLDERSETTAQRLLRRYGVVFRDLLARESLPESWREIHRALRRLEARGLVRGGRFVSGFTGEQFALPEAVSPLRKLRSAPADARELRVSAADPLNLAGILTPGARVPAGHTRWLVMRRDGLPVAVLDRGRRTELAGAATPEIESLKERAGSS